MGAMWSWNGDVPNDVFIAGGTISVNDLVILNTTTALVTRAAASGSAIDSTTISGGILGLARNATDASGQTVSVSLLTSFTGLTIPTYSTAPTLALLGTAPTTYYTGRNDGGVFKINLGTTTNGVFRFWNMDEDSGRPLVVGGVTAAGLQTGLHYKTSGYAAGDNVKVIVPTAYRAISG